MGTSSKKKYYYDLDKYAHRVEKFKNKDLYEFTKDEIETLIKSAKLKRQEYRGGFTTAAKTYLTWACIEYRLRNNPFDKIDSTSLNNNSEATEVDEYKSLKEFLEFLPKLKDCTDVDRAMLALIRYGVKINKVGNVKWEDLDRENKILKVKANNGFVYLPIDDSFIKIIDNAKECTSRMIGRKEYAYTDHGYIVKPTTKKDWVNITGRDAHNRVGRISDCNKINRISVTGLKISRKYDLLIEKYKENERLDSDNIGEVLRTLDSKSSASIVHTFRMNFEAVTGIKVDKLPTGVKEGEWHKNRELFDEDKSDKDESPVENNFIDNEDSNYQNAIYNAFATDDHDYNDIDADNYEYKSKEKDGDESEQNTTTITTANHRDPKLGAIALRLGKYECVVEKNHRTFIAKTTSKNYVEVHHLIPMMYYDEFPSNIDNEANLVTLCPTCHSFLHHGNFEGIIKLDKPFINTDIYEIISNIICNKKSNIISYFFCYKLCYFK